MKGVIATLAPNTIIDDATHEIAPGDILSGAIVLGRYFHLYPPGSIHIAVVDPGVGTDRRALAANIDGRLIVAPDNGLISQVLQHSKVAGREGGRRRHEIVEITHADILRDGVSATFHGRDIFAPAAGHLAAGLPLDELGPQLENPVLLDFPPPLIRGDEVVGVVIAVDHFGNLITNIPGSMIPPRARISLRDGSTAQLEHTYGVVKSGQLVAVIGSDGLLEIAVRNGSAAALTNKGRGARVTAKTG